MSDAQKLLDRLCSERETEPRNPRATDVSLSSTVSIESNLHFTPLAELLAEPKENTPYICDGLLPAGGTSILAARPKVGKSTAARTLALCVARGEPFLGRACVHGPVAWLALEEKRGELARQFRELECTDERIEFFCGRAPHKLIEPLRDYIARAKPALVVLDPLIRAARARDLNDYSEVSAIIEPFTHIARETGAHVMFLHHTPKSGDDPLGSTTLFGSVDTLLVLKKGADGRRTIKSTQRYGIDLEETVLEREPTGFISSAGTQRETDDADARTLIIEFLESQDEPVNERCLRENIEIRHSIAVESLRGLVKDDMVERCGSGKKGDPYRYSLSARILVPEVPAYTREQEKTNSENDEDARRMGSFSGSRDSAVSAAQHSRGGNEETETRQALLFNVGEDADEIV